MRYFSPPFFVSNGKLPVLLDNESSSAYDGGGSDGVVPLGGKFHAGFQLIEDVVNGGSGARCACAHRVGGKLIVVNLSVRCP